MACPRCGRKSKKLYKGYCSEVHLKLSEGTKGEWVRLFCAVCSRPIFRRPSRVPKKGNAVCPRCSKNQGENHGRFKGARYKDTQGYVHILIRNHYVLEHRYRWQQANRACILPWQPAHVHHVNFVRDYNEPKNLLLLPAQEHLRIHMYLRYGNNEKAYEIMRRYALTQLVYPVEIDAYASKDQLKKTSTKESK